MLVLSMMLIVSCKCKLIIFVWASLCLSPKRSLGALSSVLHSFMKERPPLLAAGTSCEDLDSQPTSVKFS